MKIFNYINREHVEPIDLGTLGRTYNTLEQGHKEAVKATSDLKATLANLDLNEAEAGWRQGKLAELNQIVAENTKFGNQYGALDDVIAQAGNLAADHGMIGRLQAQKDFKDFHKSLDANSNIDEDMKRMYREENKYYYKDTVDDKGSVIGGTKWEATSKPVNTVDIYSVMSRALGTVAKEAGSGTKITFIDANGKETSDYRKSVNGEMFMKTSSSFEKLPEEKIRRAVNTAIDATPGARASLEQDYKLANWKYSKNPVDENGNPKIVNGFTDSKGNILTIDKFIDAKVIPFAKDSAYAHYRNDSALGGALSTYKQAQAAQTPAGVKGYGNATGIAGIPNTVLTGTKSVGVKESTIDNFATTVKNANASSQSAISMIGAINPEIGRKIGSVSDFIQKYKGANGTIGPGTAVNKFIQEQRSKGINVSPQDAFVLNNAVKSWYAYDTERKNIMKPLTKREQQALQFSANASNGEFTSGASEYDNNIIKRNNQIWQKNDQVNINLSPNLVYKIKELKGADYLKGLGIAMSNSDGDIVLNINSNNRNLLPELMSTIDKADNEVGASWRGLKNKFTKGLNKDYSITGMKNGKPTKGFFEGNNVISLNDEASGDSRWSQFGNDVVNSFTGAINTVIGVNDVIGDTEYNMLALAKTYDRGINTSSKVQQKAGISKGIVSIESTGLRTAREAELKQMYANGLIDKFSEFKAQADYASEELDNVFKNPNFSSGYVYQDNGTGKYEDVKNPLELQQLVAYMYRNHKNNISRDYVSSTGDMNFKNGRAVKDGYSLEFTVPKNDTDLKEYAGKSFRIIVGGINVEPLSTRPELNTTNISTTIYNSSKSTGTPARILDYSTSLGNTDVTFKNNKPFINILGKSTEVDNGYAIKHLSNVKTIDDIASSIVMLGGMKNLPNPMQAYEHIKSIASEIGSVTNTNPAFIENAIFQHIQEKINENNNN